MDTHVILIRFIVGAFLLWCILMGIDNIGLAKIVNSGIVTEKHYTKAHSITVSTPLDMGGVLITHKPQPEIFSITIDFKNILYSVEIKESLYKKLDIGKPVTVEYTKGRISGKVYLTGII